jgi:transcriptional regulator GlxA family with amidase domain
MTRAENMSLTPASKPLRIGFLLLPQASMVDYAIASEVLSRANDLAEKKLYEPLTLSLSGDPVTLQNRLVTPVDLPLGYAPKLDLLFVLADDLSSSFPLELLTSGIQAQGLDKLLLAAVGCGSYWLAKAGLLHGYRATIHWQEINRFTEEFPDIIVTSNLYEIDRTRMSCAGGAATFDFLMQLIANHQGQEFAGILSERFSMERIRPSNERQRIPLATRIGNSQPKLTDAVALMEANIEEPLSTDDISYYVGVSRRQLERLFKQHLNTVPSKYYLELRLNRARQLLQQTSKSIVQIGLACGFSSGPHFSSSYRNHFGITPREERAQRLNAAAG